MIPSCLGSSNHSTIRPTVMLNDSPDTKVMEFRKPDAAAELIWTDVQTGSSPEPNPKNNSRKGPQNIPEWDTGWYRSIFKLGSKIIHQRGWWIVWFLALPAERCSVLVHLRIISKSSRSSDRSLFVAVKPSCWLAAHLCHKDNRVASQSRRDKNMFFAVLCWLPSGELT